MWGKKKMWNDFVVGIDGWPDGAARESLVVVGAGVMDLWSGPLRVIS
jgi:hypothetical protein